LAETIGPSTHAVVEQLLADRPLDRLRSVQALLRLMDQVGETRLEAACKRANHFGDVRYRRIKDILNAALDQQPLPVVIQSPVTRSAFAFQRSAVEFFGREGERC
jgi:hypothetical protein